MRCSRCSPGAAVDSLASLQAAGIPYVGQTCNTNATLSGQFATFCFGSDFVGLYSSSASYLKSLTTIKRVALPYIAVPAATSGVKAYAVPIFQRAGITPVEVPIPEGTADITQIWIGMLEANPPPDATVGLLTGPGCITAMKTKPTTPTQKPLVLPAMCTDADVVHDAGPDRQGHAVRAPDRGDRPQERRREDLQQGDGAVRRGDRSRRRVRAGGLRVGDEPRRARCARFPSARPSTPRPPRTRSKTAKAVPLFLGGGGTYTCDGTAFPTLKSLCSVQSHVVEYQGKQRWVDKGVF